VVALFNIGVVAAVEFIFCYCYSRPMSSRVSAARGSLVFFS
jgi:hypothetical protein